MVRPGILSSVLLVCLCGVTCILILQHRRTLFVITVQSDPPVHEMGGNIQQRGRIKHPSVIFRCNKDQPEIQSPSHASDDLTDIVMSTSDECGDTSITDAVLIVHTAADHFKKRKLLREAYSNYNNTKPYRLKVVFLIGSVIDAGLTLMLEKENRDFGDTVIGSFLDTYRNLTLKAVMGFKWVVKNCRNTKLLIKMDDDVLFDVTKFFSRYWFKIGNDRKRRSLHCLVWHNAEVNRVGKWKVERGLFPNVKYPFPYCAGFFVAITPDLIEPMYLLGKSIDFFWIDDVFLYGLVPMSIKNVHFIQLSGNRKFVAQSYEELDACRKKNGKFSCAMWATVIDREFEFDLEYNSLLAPVT